MSNDALDGRACLPLIVQDQGLGMEESPSDRGRVIQSHRGSLPTRVEPCLPDALGGLELIMSEEAKSERPMWSRRHGDA